MSNNIARINAILKIAKQISAINSLFFNTITIRNIHINNGIVNLAKDIGMPAIMVLFFFIRFSYVLFKNYKKINKFGRLDLFNVSLI